MAEDLYLDRAANDVSLAALKQMFADAGADHLYIKRLAANDNSKNQLYIGSSAEQTRPVPTGPWQKLEGTSRKEGKEHGPILQASVNWAWMRPDGQAVVAPNAKMICYPQYGNEFRLSGFLEGASSRPSTLLDPNKRGREPGRILFLGIAGTRVLAIVLSADSAAAKDALKEEERALASKAGEVLRIGVLTALSLPGKARHEATRGELIEVLDRIHERGWVAARLLKSDGKSVPVSGPQAIGQTLLAELGVAADGRKIPDYRGWEVKAFTVKKCTSRASKKVTLMTPEPTGGYYGLNGARAFLAKYGLATAKRPDVLYFEGSHRFDVRHEKRGTTLMLKGFDHASGQFDTSGGIQLVDRDGQLAAEWDFARLVEHWRAKHARAVFVPAEADSGPPKRFRYCPEVHTAEGNPFKKLLSTIAAGKLIYDPGIRFDPTSRAPLKGRNQFRITVPACLELVYDKVMPYIDVRARD